MRYAAILLVLAFLHNTVAAQHIETLVRGRDDWSFFIQPEIKTTRLSDKSAQLAGLRLGPALDRTLHLGLAGYALVSSIDPDSVRYQRLTAFDLWTVGLTIDYTFFPNRVVHPGFGCFIGAGQISAGLHDPDASRESATLFLIEPQANLMFNLTETLELGLGASYRFVNGSDIRQLADSDLSGLTGSVFLRWTEMP